LAPAVFRSETRGDFNEKLLDTIKKYNPEIIFIGNSMLYTRIDEVHYGQLSGKKVFLLKMPGLGSAGWYLSFKNFICAPNLKPSVVYIFFRDTELTDPLFRTTGKYIYRLQRLSTNDETELDDILYFNKSTGEKIEYYLEKLYPVLSHNKRIDGSMNIIALKSVNSITGNKLKNDDVNELFQFDNFRPVQVDGENIIESIDKNCYDFNNRLPVSFLPSIVNMAKTNGVKLAFIRVQKRPTDTRAPYQSEQLLSYVAELKKYIEANNCLFHDFTGDSRITLSMYGGGDHIDVKYKKKYTKIFYDTLKEKSIY